MKRREFLAGTLPLALCLDVPAALTSTDGAPRACITTGEDRRPPDVTGIFEELGIGYDLVPLNAADIADCKRYSLLWITGPEYPYHTELSPRMVATIETFLKAGRGVFAEFTLNFPGVPAAARPQKTGIARLFVSSPLDSVAGCLPAGTILDEHDSICLPLTGEARGFHDVLSFGKVKGVERVMEAPAPERTWPGVVWGGRDSGRFALATTSISDFRRREYAPQTHWQRLLRDLVLALLLPEERAAVSAAYIPIKAYTEPRVWALPNSPLTLVVETAAGARVTIAGVQTRQTAPGRFEAALTSGPAALRTITGSIATTKTRKNVQVGVRIAPRRDAYRRAPRPKHRLVRTFRRTSQPGRFAGRERMDLRSGYQRQSHPLWQGATVLTRTGRLCFSIRARVSLVRRRCGERASSQCRRESVALNPRLAAIGPRRCPVRLVVHARTLGTSLPG